jgi:hypothetical protein
MPCSGMLRRVAVVRTDVLNLIRVLVCQREQGVGLPTASSRMSQTAGGFTEIRMRSLLTERHRVRATGVRT